MIIEGLACGVPTIPTEVVSAREFLKGHGCGLVVAQVDHAGLAAAVDGAREARELFDFEACGRVYMEKYKRPAKASRSFSET